MTDPKSISVVGTGIDFILVNRKTNFVVNCGENMSENIYVSITGNHSNEIENHHQYAHLPLSHFSSVVIGSVILSVSV